jgi:LuxR family maltose regulon positive regulatory protein
MHVVIATRMDPPLDLGTLRARGELAELRADALRFGNDEAVTLLTERLGLSLSTADVDRLVERTEGWAAGLYLGALSLRERSDAAAFIAGFAGSHRHIVDYLGGEVLDKLPAEIHTFLVQTSILDRFSPSLCDAVVLQTGAATWLRTLERTNQFVIRLDPQGEWYRYHHLFRDLLQIELERTQPDLLPVLHQRAAAWYRADGNVDAAMRHALAAKDYALAADLILAHAQPFLAAGRLSTVAGWMEQFPEEAIATRPALMLAVAWVSAADSRSQWEVERWLPTAEASKYEGPFPLGEHSMRSAVALLRAGNLFDDVGRTLRAAQVAVELETDPETLAYVIARAALGQALYYSGRSEEAREPLEAAIRAPLAARQSPALIRAITVLALVCFDLVEVDMGEDLVRRAVELCESNGFAAHPQAWLTYVALSTVYLRHGRFDEAETVLANCVEPHLPAFRQWPIAYAHSLLALAPVRAARGHGAAAQMLVREARAVLALCPDPGMLPAHLEETERLLPRAPRRQTQLREPLSEMQLRVLRLLRSDLTQHEIARELYLSVNTIKSHVRGIYTKLDVASRAEAVTCARDLGLIA